MHAWWIRGNAVLTLCTSVLAAVCVAVSITGALQNNLAKLRQDGFASVALKVMVTTMASLERQLHSVVALNFSWGISRRVTQERSLCAR